MDLAKKTIKNSLFGILEFAWPILLSLLATPFIIRKLGTDAYGILALVTVVLGFLAFLDLGFTNAAIKYISEEYAKKDYGRINKIINSTLLVYITMGIIGGAALFSFSNSLAVKILNVPPHLIEITKFAFYVASLGLLLNMVLGAFACVPKALQRFDISTKISMIIGTLTTLGTVSLLYAGFWLKELIIFNLTVSIISIVVYVIVSKKLLPFLKIRPSFDKKTFLMLFSFGSLALVASLSGLIVFNLDKFLIGSLISVTVIAFYVVPGNIAVKIQGLITAMVNIVFPVSSTLAGNNETDKLKTLYFKGSKLVLIVSTMLSVPLFVFSGKFLLYWLGKDFAQASTTVMMILVATYYLLSINGTLWNISYGLGRVKINAFFSWLTAVLNVVLIFVLAKPFGIIGVAWAYFISVIISVPLAIVYMERKLLNLSGLEYWKIYSKILAVGVIQFVLTSFLTRFASNIFLTLLLMALSVFIFPLIYLALGFFKDEDREILNIFKQYVIKRQKG